MTRDHHPYILRKPLSHMTNTTQTPTPGHPSNPSRFRKNPIFPPEPTFSGPFPKREFLVHMTTSLPLSGARKICIRHTIAYTTPRWILRHSVSQDSNDGNLLTTGTATVPQCCRMEPRAPSLGFSSLVHLLSLRFGASAVSFKFMRYSAL